MVREIPNRSAIRAFGTPSEANLLINAQSSKVITLQSSSVHFSSVVTVQFSSVVDRSLAVPVKDEGGATIAAINVSVAAGGHSLEELTSDLLSRPRARAAAIEQAFR